MGAASDQLESAYITVNGGPDREAILHRRRKSAIRSLLVQFEREIVPLVADGNAETIDRFKRCCREKLNALTWEAVELLKLSPGDLLNEHAADLAGQLAFADNDDDGGLNDK